MKKFHKIGFGTWEFGGRSHPNPDNDDQKDISNIRNALLAGIKHIDTASSYAGGKCEELVGQALKGFNRQDLFIATKVHGTDLRYQDAIDSCERSLRRLDLQNVDLFYVHSPNPEIPIAETAQALNDLQNAGLIKNIGISNAKKETMQEYQKYLKAPIFASQCHYNLIAREPQRTGLLDYCKKNQINFIAWRPIQLPVPSMGIEPLYKRGAYALLDEMADKYGKTNAQIAVRWLTAQENVNILFKSTNPAHITDILETENFTLSDKDMRLLTEKFPRQEDVGFISSGPKPLL